MFDNVNFIFYRRTFFYTIKSWFFTVLFGTIALFAYSRCSDFQLGQVLVYVRILFFTIAIAFCVSAPALLLFILLNQFLARCFIGVMFKSLISILGLLLLASTFGIIFGGGIDDESRLFVVPYALTGLFFTWFLQAEEHDNLME